VANGWFDDTNPKALDVWLDLIRAMTPGERAARVFEMTDFLQSLQEGDVRRNYPEAGDREVFLRVASRRLDRETMIKVYGWDPEMHP
jgi:hypothetical protein